MSGIDALTREVDALEQLQRELAAVVKRDDDGRRFELIALRKLLSSKISQIGKLADPVFGRHHDPNIAIAYREKFSRMRSTAAMHQASWPAVFLGERVDEFEASAMGVREANRDFVGWMRKTLPLIDNRRA